MHPPIRSSPTDGRTNSFSPSIRTSSFWRTLTAITLSGSQEVLPTPARRKYSTGSSLLTSFFSMTLTHSPFYIAPPLTFPVLLSLLPFLAPGRCFRIWVLTTCQFFYLFLSLRSFAPTSVSLPSTFRKLAGMALSPTVLLQRNTRLFLSSVSALFTSLALNPTKFFIAFGRIKRNPKTWWSPEVESAFGERRKAFAAAQRSDEDRQAYISACRRASSVIAKAKTEAWQTTCSSLSSKSNPQLYTLFFTLSLALFPRVLPLLTSPTVLLPGNRLRSLPITGDTTIPFLSQRPCVAEPEATFPSSAEPRSRRSLTRLSALLSPRMNFLRLPPTFPRPLPLGQILSYAKAPSSLWLGFSSPHLQSFLVFAFLSFHLEDIFYYFHTQDGNDPRLSCFLPAYLSYHLRIKAY